MIDAAMLERVYTYFYQHKYSDYKYKLKKSKTTASHCDSFLKIIDKEYSLYAVTENFLWDYFVFQWSYWEDTSLENKFSNEVSLSWIIGKKAFQRWKERNQEHDWQIDKSWFADKYNLDKKELFAVRELKTESKFDSSKPIRKQYLNTKQGLAMCTEFTTLFDPKDFSCIRCESRTDCRQLLKANYPALYNVRIKS